MVPLGAIFPTLGIGVQEDFKTRAEAMRREATASPGPPFPGGPEREWYNRAFLYP